MVTSRFTRHTVISLAAGSVSNYRTPRSSLRKLFITSGRRGYSTLVCSLYLSTHQSPVSYRCGYICLLCCSRHKLELEYAVTWLLGAALTALYGDILSTFTGVEPSLEVRNYRAHQIKLEK